MVTRIADLQASLVLLPRDRLAAVGHEVSQRPSQVPSLPSQARHFLVRCCRTAGVVAPVGRWLGRSHFGCCRLELAWRRNGRRLFGDRMEPLLCSLPLLCLVWHRFAPRGKGRTLAVSGQSTKKGARCRNPPQKGGSSNGLFQYRAIYAQLVLIPCPLVSLSFVTLAVYYGVRRIFQSALEHPGKSLSSCSSRDLGRLFRSALLGQPDSMPDDLGNLLDESTIARRASRHTKSVPDTFAPSKSGTQVPL